MVWEVLLVDELKEWLTTLDPGVRAEVLARTNLLRERGPQLGRPYVDTLKGSIFSNLKELRMQHRGQPWRVLFAFDPNRAAVLLLGGNKGGDRRWSETNLPLAEERFRRHLEDLEARGDHGDST